MIGVKMDDEFDFPVCKGFRAKILNDQLCYEVDPNRFKKNNLVSKDLGISFYVDTNKDRMFATDTDTDSKFLVYVDTISKYRVPYQNDPS